jgi:Ser/Thr protein kinase RdoA (MazF antagonist)
MKTYKELTRLGRLRRLRILAEKALEEYGLSGAKLTYTHSEGNVIFRVDVSGPQQKENGVSPYVPNRYNLRLLATNDAQMVNSELTWLKALSQEAGIPVPEPIPTLKGELITKIITPGVPQGKLVSLMRWMDGRILTKGFTPKHLKSWGEVTAQMHNFSASWKPPKGFQRPHWDWHGQLGGRDFRNPYDKILETIPKKYYEAFNEISAKSKKMMESLGKGKDAYGMIHADLFPENVIFKGGQARLIDFEDCGYGYWMWDIGMALHPWAWTEKWDEMREAFLAGYTQIQPIPDSQLQHLDLFIAAHHATMVIWASAFILHDPTLTNEYEEWRTEDGDRLLRYFIR